MANKRFSRALFIFRRDLRLHDNTALNHALAQSTQVFPCFIFDPRQIQPHAYQSRPALQFMQQSLHDLSQALQSQGSNLSCYHGLPVDVVRRLVSTFGIDAVFVNRDYTPFSHRRDEGLNQVCNELGIHFISLADALLNEPETLLKSDRSPYKVFTAFYNCARQRAVNAPVALGNTDFMYDRQALYDDVSATLLPEKNGDIAMGGRQQALNILAKLSEQAEYAGNRDFPALDTTTKLSAHLKFGTCSIREAYFAILLQLGVEHPLLRQLYWRDFFTHITFHYPDVFGKAFLSQYDGLVWDNNRDYFQRWSEGKTGFPIVDAGMRELNTTGFMHNRVRMIAASFLIKDLHISWRWGERYFAQHLVDYDPAVNNGNWQWAASTGCDAQPYFRIFNPWLQQKKFDPDCVYIKHWLPELRQVLPATIHRWYDQDTNCTVYPSPMVDHAVESYLTKERYRHLAQRLKNNV